LPAELRVVVDDSAETIIDTIEDAKAGADFVVVDLEGTATDRIGFAVARSDLVLIPLQSSVLDAAEAAKSVKLVRQMWRVANREIPYRVFFTRVPPAIRERTARDIDRQFAGASIPVLPATLIDRAAYRTLFSLGGTVHELERADVSGLDSAKENAREFAQAVINAIRGEAA
jgi:chromosome partitioning protein